MQAHYAIPVRWTIFLLCSSSLVANVSAAISVSPNGTGTVTFDTAPTGTDFLTAFYGGDGASFTTESQIADVISSVSASQFLPNFTLPTTATLPPTLYAYGFRYNSVGQFLQSRATTTSGAAGNPTSAATVMLATLQNDTGQTLTSVNVGYDMATTSPVAGELPGFQVFFSTTGASQSW